MTDGKRANEARERVSARALFEASVVAWVLDRKAPVRVRMTGEQATALFEAVRATRELMSGLKSEAATVESITDLAERKREAAIAFGDAFGVKWPL